MASRYTLSAAFTSEQRTRAVELLTWGVKENWSTTRVQEILQREGLGYRRAVLIQDYAHAHVVALSKTPEASARAESFYERVYLPFKEEHGLNSTQMGTIMSAFNREIEPPEDLIDLVDEWDVWTEETGS